MSENATQAPAETNTEAKGGDSLNFADALDIGINSLDTPTSKPISEPAPVPAETSVQKQSPVSEKSADNKLDFVADRFLKKDEPVSNDTTAEDIEVKTPENLKPEAQTAWARLTKDLRDTRAKLKELESKASEAPQNSIEQQDFKAQLETIKAERDAYENELRFSRLEATKEYKQAVTEPLSVIQKEVADISALYETDPRSIYAAMIETDPAKRRALLKEATSSFDPVDSLSIRNKAEELQKVFERRDLLTKDVRTVLEMLENDEKQEMEAYQKRSMEELNNAYKSEWESFQADNPLLRPLKDNEAWNNTLKSIEQHALQIENTDLEPRQKARLT
ncbi:hypothetical protein EBR78_11210, partial [bacterium]|nr:hypothetical protein [bacterium]